MSSAEPLNPSRLQAAVDELEPAKVVGGSNEPASVVGIDVIPGIVVSQPGGGLEAPGIVYLEAGRSGRSSSRRATIQFHVANDTIVVDRVVLAERHEPDR